MDDKQNKEPLSDEALAECRAAAEAVRAAFPYRSVSGLKSDPDRIRWHLDNTPIGEADAVFERTMAELAAYRAILLRGKLEWPHAYEHLVWALGHGSYLPGETLPEAETEPAILLLSDPKRTFELVRSVHDGRLARLLEIADLGCEPPEDLADLAAGFPSHSDPVIRSSGFLSICLEWIWTHDVLAKDIMAKRAIQDSTFLEVSNWLGAYQLSWRSMRKAGTSGFHGLEPVEIDRIGGRPDMPIVQLALSDGRPEVREMILGAPERLRQESDTLAVFEFRVPRRKLGTVPYFHVETVLVHSAEEHARWQAREPMFASLNVSHGYGAVLADPGRIYAADYLRGGYVVPHPRGSRFVFGSHGS